ncbi:hypothetical protein [Actinokineospora globicatena]|uniref:Integron gene cassette protein n=1 Tax=Actinokineospora globicatena TaxID=103729 RepID=A0A9W6QKS2_9PSEU|nr:hypothetical protein [Actinokineospora globicatena]GLW90460.1 hypothetical protein Aglo03_12760 [Actinokineospora globicatena]
MTVHDPRLADCLRDHQAGGYPVAHVVDSVCVCGGQEFRVAVDDTQGWAERFCVACEEITAIADSAEHWDHAEPGECECPCGGGTFAVAVGFAEYADGEIRWVSVGLRCLTDDTVGVYTDWKIDYSPSRHLLDHA